MVWIQLMRRQALALAEDSGKFRISNLSRQWARVASSVSQRWSRGFARDVTAAMLVVKNKSISFLWEKKILLYWKHGHLVKWLQTKNSDVVVICSLHRLFYMFTGPLSNTELQ